MEEQFKCPVCNSPLSKSKYYEVIGAEEERKKLEANLKKQLDEAEKNKKKLAKEKIELKKKFEKQQQEALKKFKLEFEKKQKKELSRAQKEFLAKGKEQEKKRAEKLIKSSEEKAKKIEGLNKTIKELREQIKKGTTPQVEGLNMEEELVKELRVKFPEDYIEHKGHGGDILHYIKYKDKEIGLIVYECKKTQDFKKDYIRQIKNDVSKRNASYGVLITQASQKDKSGFWIDNDILIVHPYGTIYIAEFLRKSILDLYSLKLNKEELTECAKKLLIYIKSDKFKNCVEDNIHRTKELNELLTKEMITHKNIWEKRDKHYRKIFENSKSVNLDCSAILRNEKQTFIQIEKDPGILIIPKKKKRKV